MAGIRIAAVMAVHNRRALTLACLDSLRAQQLPGATLDVFVLDDASTDGTAEAVTQHHPDVRLLRGDGHLYWNGGMRRALDQAMAGDYDYYLWMNDDTTLSTTASSPCSCTPSSSCASAATAPSSWPAPPGTHRPANPPTAARSGSPPGAR